MGTQTVNALSTGGRILEIVETGSGVSGWVEISFEAGLFLRVPAGCSAVVEQATELPSVTGSSPEAVRGRQWPLGVITGPSDVDSYVLGATHARLKVLSGAGPVSLMIRGRL